METVTIHAAKTKLPQLLALVDAGDEIILARGNEPIAKLVASRTAPTKRSSQICDIYRGARSWWAALLSAPSQRTAAQV
jgi:antitoxin (DNA-binding transcriptional repressor) of toxin-antitoxin stability system